MRDRETTVERENARSRSGADPSPEPLEGDTAVADEGGGLRTRARSRLASLFSVRQFLLGTVAALAGLLVVGGALPLGAVGDLLGILVGGFVHGAVASDRRYVEAALAGGLVAGGAAFLDHLVVTALGLGVPVVALGTLGGAVAGALGHYFGRDLRDGLTRDL